MATQKMNPDWQKQLDEQYERGRRLVEMPFVREHLEKAATWEADRHYEGRLKHADFWAGMTESPIEAAFVLWWVCYEGVYVPQVSLKTQVTVEAEGRVYRVDIALSPSAKSDSMLKDLADHLMCPRIAVELDGHDFHERTRQQVTQRNQRDRSLESAGWKVLHFSGSEFNTDPLRVISEVHTRASSYFADAMVAIGKWSEQQRLNTRNIYGF